jgi:hypothetical protein
MFNNSAGYFPGKPDRFMGLPLEPGLFPVQFFTGVPANSVDRFSKSLPTLPDFFRNVQQPCRTFFGIVSSRSALFF